MKKGNGIVGEYPPATHPQSPYATIFGGILAWSLKVPGWKFILILCLHIYAPFPVFLGKNRKLRNLAGKPGKKWADLKF
jgi:hypothetical protein